LVTTFVTGVVTINTRVVVTICFVLAGVESVSSATELDLPSVPAVARTVK
jgi:hypothetical protein